MSRFSCYIAIFAMIATSGIAMAEEQEGKRPGFRFGDRAKAGAQGDRQAMKRGGAMAMPVDRLVPMMMQRFDTDGDQKLNVDELTAMLKSFQERRGAGGGQAGARKRPGGGGPGQGKGTPGGDKPKRPKAE